MRRIMGLTLLALLATVFSGRAWADTVWNLNAGFTYNQTSNTAMGTITLNSALQVTAWDITVSGTNTLANDVYTTGNDIVVFPDLTHLDFYDASTNQYINLYLSSPFTNAGGTIGLLEGDKGATDNSTVVCAGCGVLSQGSLSAAPTPEPGSMALLGTAVGALGMIKRRWLKRS